MDELLRIGLVVVFRLGCIFGFGWVVFLPLAVMAAVVWLLATWGGPRDPRWNEQEERDE